MVGRHVALLYAPFSGGVGIAGCEAAPTALRLAGLGPSLRGTGHRVREQRLAMPRCDPDVHAAWPQLLHACRVVRAAVNDSLAGGELPVLVGGDHSLSIGSIAAVSRRCRMLKRPLWVLWLDAHADFNTFATTPTGNLHGMPAAVICGVGDKRLLGLGNERPMVEPSRVWMLGVRAIDTGEQALLQASAVRVYPMREVRRCGLDKLVEALLGQVATSGGHLHVSIDVDVMDPAAAPGVGSPEPDGVGLDAMRQGLQRIAASGLLGSLDVMELNPLLDSRGVTVRLTVGLIGSALGESQTFRSVGGLN